MSIIPQWLQNKRNLVADEKLYKPSRETRVDAIAETGLLRDVAFNRHSMNDGEHVSPFDNGKIQVGGDGIEVKLVQGIDEESFLRTIAMATRATIGIDLSASDVEDFVAGADADEMLKGGLQTALESAVIVFAISGVSRTCTHQIVRSRRAAFHQQSQRASYYGDRPEVRIPESVWNNPKARAAFIIAKKASDDAYRVACEEDISYQDARYALLEGTDNYIMCEYSVREFIDVFNYRGCSMFSWEIVTVMRKMRALLIDAHPFLEPHVRISCEKTRPTVVPFEHPTLGPMANEYEHSCTFQGWESPEGQCPFSWAKDENRTFKPMLHQIKKRADNA